MGQRKNEGIDMSAIPENKRSQFSEMQRNNIQPYPSEIPERTDFANEVNESREGEMVTVMGRITEIRIHGKIAFVNLKDQSGVVQIAILKDKAGQEAYELFIKIFTRGDIISATGDIFKTNKGIVSVNASEIQMLSKALQNAPLNLEDPEIRSRQRYLDLLVNPESREIILTRSRIIQFIRERLMSLGCYEIDTPTLATSYNGGVAKPFISFHNALGSDIYLRMTSELYLKKLIVGGFEAVFEIAKMFRNEGMGFIYNPEFTVVEVYKAYTDHHYMMEIAENLLSDMALSLKGTTQVVWFGNEIDLKVPWRRLTVKDGLSEVLGVDFNNISNEDLIKIAQDRGIEDNDIDQIILKLFRIFVEPTLIQPTFVTNYPLSANPLAKVDTNDSTTIQKFICFIGGHGIMDSNYEENDPIKQRENFEKQMEQKRKDGITVYPGDQDFVEAMSYGMPPLSGLAMGIERLTMILTGKENIRDILTFPSRREHRNPNHNREQ